MKEQNLLIEVDVPCKECGGDGYLDVGPECDRPASMCCGGCYTTQVCEHCYNGNVTIKMDADIIAELVVSVFMGDMETAKGIIYESQVK